MDVSMLPPRDISASIAEHRARVVENIEIAHRIAKENIQRAQQRMKDYHDLHAVPINHQIGDRVWVYTPRNRKGMSKKLAHNWHGPFRIVQFLSPVDCILRSVDNRRVLTTVHVSRLKRYVSPDTRPIRQPPENVDESYLTEDDLPPYSFLSADTDPVPGTDGSAEANVQPEQSIIQPSANQGPGSQNVPLTQSYTRTERTQSSSTPDEHRGVPLPNPTSPSTADRNIYTVEKLLKQRFHNGDPHFLVKWLDFPSSQNTWKPLTNILDKRLIANFYKQHPRARQLRDPDYVPRVAPLLLDDDPFFEPVISVLSYPADGPDSAPFSASSEALHCDFRKATDHPPLHEVSTLHVPLTPPAKSCTHLPMIPPELPQVSFPVLSSSQPDVALHIPVTENPLPYHQEPGHLATRDPPLPPRQDILTQRGRTIWRHKFPHHWLLTVLFLFIIIVPVKTQEYDESGKRITFFPDSLMMATNPRPLIFF